MEWKPCIRNVRDRILRMNDYTQNKHYILTLIETQSDRVFSTFLTRLRITTIIGVILGGFILSSLILSQVFRRLQVNRETQKENRILREVFTTWEQKTQNLQRLLTELTKKNQRIQHLATFSPPKIDYGVGGQKTVSWFAPVEKKEVNNNEINLLKLEMELDWLKKSMAELEKSVTFRKDQIANLPSIRPVRHGWISSGFGQRIDPFTDELVDHPGIDISIQIGSDVYATATGVVKEIRTTAIPNKGYGKFVLIEHGFGYKTLYAHLSEVFVKQGQEVERWEVIGLSGETGKSTAPHLHYGVFSYNRPHDPMNFILNQPKP